MSLYVNRGSEEASADHASQHAHRQAQPNSAAAATTPAAATLPAALQADPVERQVALQVGHSGWYGRIVSGACRPAKVFLAVHLLRSLRASPATAKY